jgi:hypothetical protein
MATTVATTFSRREAGRPEILATNVLTQVKGYKSAQLSKNNEIKKSHKATQIILP